MKRTLCYTITEKENQMPIGSYLKSMGISASSLIALKKIPESILLNGKWEYVNAKVSTGDILTLHLEEHESSEKIVPVDLPLDIIYEDEDILVINKAADTPIHPSLNNYENTLANAVSFYFASQSIPFVFRCINRLDRDTTGLTIIAKHMISAGILSDMVAKREIHREYLAVVRTSNPLSPTGIIDAPISRVEGSTIERQVDVQKGERAVTHYQILSSNLERDLSLALLWLETGRTHQIRVHMRHVGAPLIGDFIYNPDMTYINRQALHSYRLSFTHPITKEPMQFCAPVPHDMQAAFNLPMHIPLY